MRKRVRCVIEECNSYVTYQHLGLCRRHYAYLNGPLGWKNPSMYMDSDSAKRIIEHKFKWEEKP